MSADGIDFMFCLTHEILVLLDVREYAKRCNSTKKPSIYMYQGLFASISSNLFWPDRSTRAAISHCDPQANSI